MSVKYLRYLRREKLYAKESKCEFFKTEVEFLVIMLVVHGVTNDGRKVQGSSLSGQYQRRLQKYDRFLVQ